MATSIPEREVFQVVGEYDPETYPGTSDFLNLLRQLGSAALGGPAPGGLVAQLYDADELLAAQSLFQWQGGDDIIVSRAPGRLDVMGGIADYSGSLVLQLPLGEACHVAAQRLRPGTSTDAPMLRIVSLGARAACRTSQYEIPLAKLMSRDGKGPLRLEEARAMLSADLGAAWAAYVVGVALELTHRASAAGADVLREGRGLALLVSSSVPEGKGVSSSAAVEVASMTALAAALGMDLAAGGGEVVGLDAAAACDATRGRVLALACQRVENVVVGAPCGVMDQMASALGRHGTLMALTCQPCRYEGNVAIPPHLRFWGIDSGERHSVGGSDYVAVRTAAFMGLKLVRGALGDVEGPTPAYLAQVTSAQWAAGLEQACPAHMRGAEFLVRCGEHLDGATRVRPEASYAVRAAAAHPVGEAARVAAFRAALAEAPSDRQAAALGAAMLASHASYGACGLGSAGTDRLVQLVGQERAVAAAAGTAQVLHGAKITGGGCGGTVCVLASAGVEGEAALARVVQAYRAERGGDVAVFGGTSDGAVAFGTLRLRVAGQGG